jgi:indolepyruvate ferredoxin oxidoreductase
VEAGLGDGRTELSETAARALYRLMAYKDEYEVARLHTDPQFQRSLQTVFEGQPRLRFHLAPPLLARRDPVTGYLRKSSYGPWILPFFKILSRLKFLRGGPLDIFGHTAERRGERKLIDHYLALLEQLARHLRPDNHDAAVALAKAYMDIRGYGHIKEQTIHKVMQMHESLLQNFMASAPARTVIAIQPVHADATA